MCVNGWILMKFALSDLCNLQSQLKRSYEHIRRIQKTSQLVRQPNPIRSLEIGARSTVWVENFCGQQKLGWVLGYLEPPVVLGGCGPFFQKSSSIDGGLKQGFYMFCPSSKSTFCVYE